MARKSNFGPREHQCLLGGNLVGWVGDGFPRLTSQVWGWRNSLLGGEGGSEVEGPLLFGRHCPKGWGRNFRTV